VLGVGVDGAHGALERPIARHVSALGLEQLRPPVASDARARRSARASSATPSPLPSARSAGPRIGFLYASPLVNALQGGAVELLDFKTERDALVGAIRSSGKRVDISSENATARNLSNLLLDGCRVLHYSGHGFHTAGPAGAAQSVLAFEDGLGGTHALEVGALQQLVAAGRRADGAGGGQLELAFVSACHSVEGGEAFVRAGVPHVIAVRREARVQDRAACVFAEAFYYALLRSRTVRAAFDVGVQAVANGTGIVGAGDEALKFLLLPEAGAHERALFEEGAVEDGPPLELGLGLAPHNLPAFFPLQFLGRHALWQQVVAGAQQKRAVLLLGQLGVGKTSLAVGAAHYLLERHAFRGGARRPPGRRCPRRRRALAARAEPRARAAPTHSRPSNARARPPRARRRPRAGVYMVSLNGIHTIGALFRAICKAMHEAGGLSGGAAGGAAGAAGAVGGAGAQRAALPTDGDSFVGLLAPLLRERVPDGRVCLLLDQCEGLGLPALTLASLLSKLMARVESLVLLAASTEPLALQGVAQRQLTVPALAPLDCARLFVMLAPRALTHAEIGSDKLDRLAAEMEALVNALRPSIPQIDQFAMQAPPPAADGKGAPPMRVVRWKFEDGASADVFGAHVQRAADALAAAMDAADGGAGGGSGGGGAGGLSPLLIEVRGRSVIGRLSHLRMLSRHPLLRALAGSPRAISLAVHGLVADDGGARLLDQLGKLLEAGGIGIGAAGGAAGAPSAPWLSALSERTQQLIEQLRAALQLLPLDEPLSPQGSAGALAHAAHAGAAGSGGSALSAVGSLAALAATAAPARPLRRAADELPAELEIDASEVELEEWLGGGTFGAVYRGRYGGARVAVKQFFARSASLKAFSREAALLSHLRHDNVVALMRVCRQGGKGLLIVTEFLPQSLHAYVHEPQPTDPPRADGEGALPLAHAEVVRLSTDIARGMRYLHSFQPPVLHRNLKSQNLLLDDSGRVKVADFGAPRTLARGAARTSDPSRACSRASTPFCRRVPHAMSRPAVLACLAVASALALAFACACACACAFGCLQAGPVSRRRAAAAARPAPSSTGGSGSRPRSCRSARRASRVAPRPAACACVRWSNPDTRALAQCRLRPPPAAVRAQSKPYTEKADVYSFAMIAWEVLTRRVPFKGMNPVQIGLAVREQKLRPNLPSTCPPAYARLMERCWHDEPDSRPSFDEIVELLADHVAMSRPPS
jgi:serine/threonine protein kinase